MPARDVSEALASSARAFAVYLLSQSPSVAPERIPGMIARRFPRLDPTAVDVVFSGASQQVQAGQSFLDAGPDEVIDAASLPIDPSLASGIRLQSIAELPLAGGGVRPMTGIVDFPAGVTVGQMKQEAIDAVFEQALRGLYPIQGGSGLDLTTAIDIIFAALARGVEI